MHIELDTQTMERGDALALVALIKNRFPDLLGSASQTVINNAVEHFAAAADNGYTVGPMADATTEILVDAMDPNQPFDPAAAFGAPPALDPAAAFGSTPLSSGDAEPLAGAPTSPTVGAPASLLDTDGLPWDARIHASTKGRNADGRWKAKRNVLAEHRRQVEAELRQVMAAPGPQSQAAPPPPPPVAPVPVPPAAPTAVSTPPAAATPADAPPAPTPQQAAMAAAVANATTPPAPVAEFQRVLGKFQAGLTAGKLKNEDLQATIAAVGLPMVKDLITRPDLIPAFEAHLDALLIAAG